MTAAATHVSGSVFGEVSANWRWVLAFGILSVVLGLIGLGMVAFLTLASVVFYGVLVLVAGAAQLANSVKCKGWQSVVLHVLVSVFYLIAGVAIIRNPVLASSLFTLLLAASIIIVGFLRIWMAVQMRAAENWMWTLVGGVLAVLLGLMIVARWPVSGLWVIGLFIAIEMIANGWSYIFIALAARRIGSSGVVR